MSVRADHELIKNSQYRGQLNNGQDRDTERGLRGHIKAKIE